MKNKRTVLILISSIVIVICAAAAILVSLPEKSKGIEVYTSKVNKGIEYYNSKNYEESIKYFKEAIELEPENEDAYINLGYAYIQIGEKDLALNTWLQGHTATKSDKFLNLIAKFNLKNASNTTGIDPSSGTVPADEEKKTASGKSINSQLFMKLKEYTYSDYVTAYGQAYVSADGSTVTVTHSTFAGSFVYSTDPSGNSKIGDDGYPKDDAVPDYIRFDDVSQLFDGINGSISFDELNSLGLIGLRKGTSGGKNQVTFKYHECAVTIGSDENGNISDMSTNNMIIPPQVSGKEEGEKRHFTVDVVLATTGNHVDGRYVFEIARAEDVVSGDNSPLGSGDNIFYSQTISDGVVDVDLENGEYSVCVYPENDPNNFQRYNWEIDDNTVDVDLKLIITGTITDGQIIIVLRWGDQPRDIDAHLVSSDDHVYYQHPNGTHANLDVDCMNGNGIETITINDIEGDYTYYVNNYSGSPSMGEYSGATVEVFTPGSATPRTYTIPEDIYGIWEVFSLHNGTITDINRDATGMDL